ncbi:polysaccharide lyase family 3 protein [Zopfia rhizophila CBS 207.26]|uniref:Pectate lyase n=1 Tax=Zopfia rhizophila CBS 207.26 TaxID=1314779 RepID=A0A6A6DX51_9PEZI|nr:polysaccharide lyase family 3 protein [Zopfia rhizophila CBS 207.26]
MHFSLSTIAAAALIFSAADASPHRGHSGRPYGTGRLSGFPFPSGARPTGRPGRPSGRPSGGFPFPPANGTDFPGLSGPAPTGPVPTGFPTELPSGFPTELPSGIPTDLPSGLPTEIPSVSFAFPSSIEGNINAAAASTKTKSSKSTKTTAAVESSATGSDNSSTPASTFAPSSSAATTTFPEAAGSSSLSEPMVVDGVFDGGMVRFDRGTACGGQGEGGDSDAVFQVQEGGTLKNVIIGADQTEGVHCMGACTIENVWWEAVCEDALTIKQESGVSYVIGGGAKGADDKVVQHNGGGTISISGFYVSDFGKLYRSCGNCDTMYERHVIIDNVIADSGKVLAGINSNYGDTATITNSCVSNTKSICTEFEGNDTGDEPTEISSGISESCIYTDADTTTC